MEKVDPTICYPIIYVRGYAMTSAEKDETAADPFCGFNVGSTVYRAVADKHKPPQRFFFESPIVRLLSDYDYDHVYDAGQDLLDDTREPPVSRRSIIIYRYYDDTSPLLGGTETASIERFATGLSDLIVKLRKQVCAEPDNKLSVDTFRCYLIAHSMGGLVCRAFLQNPNYGTDEARKCVDKLFTYATPHNGIEMLGFNVPRWLGMFDISTFNRSKLSADLATEEAFKSLQRVDLISPAQFNVDRIFCMIGTNRSDYEVAAGLSRAFVGHGSDGLVRIENASVCSYERTGVVGKPAATAYAYRSHSGAFGIVNSEEAYQNLTRFLFGDARIDVYAEIDSINLPPGLTGKDTNALYQLELLAAARGVPWYLTRRVAEEDSVACRSYKELTGPQKDLRRRIYLSTVFLSRRAKISDNTDSLGYSLTFGVKVPDYEVDGRIWLDEHYEGTYLFRDTAIIEMNVPEGPDGDWVVKYGWESNRPLDVSNMLAQGKLLGASSCLQIPFGKDTAPGVSGHLLLYVSTWN